MINNFVAKAVALAREFFFARVFGSSSMSASAFRYKKQQNRWLFRRHDNGALIQQPLWPPRWSTRFLDR